jgi:hypothetical protein
MTATAHTDLQRAMRNRLAAVAGFGDLPGQCPVLAQDEGDLAAKLDAMLGRLGVVALITVPELNCTISAARPPIYDQVKARVEIYENGLMNRSASGTDIPALTWAERAAAALHGWTPPGRQQEFYLDPAGSITPQAHPSETIYLVNLKLGKR